MDLGQWVIAKSSYIRPQQQLFSPERACHSPPIRNHKHSFPKRIAFPDQLSKPLVCNNNHSISSTSRCHTGLASYEVLEPSPLHRSHGLLHIWLSIEREKDVYCLWWCLPDATLRPERQSKEWNGWRRGRSVNNLDCRVFQTVHDVAKFETASPRKKFSNIDQIKHHDILNHKIISIVIIII